MGSDTLQTDGLDYGRPCEDLGAYAWEFVMPHGWGYPPVGILLVPPDASFDPVMPKWHYGHVHENINLPHDRKGC
jgi:hypothetical protein